MSRSFELPEADWATVGTVGPPGQRVFYLQARQDSQALTLKLEKGQVAAIASFLSEILADLPAPDSDPFGPSELVEPVEAEWAVGSIQLAYDPTADRILILAEEIGLEDGSDDVEDDLAGAGGDAGLGSRDRASARVGVTRANAAMIVRVGGELVSAGRPTCPLCGRPMDPEGHSCPRTNGHKPN